MMDASFTFLNAPLAAYYGVTGTGSAEARPCAPRKRGAASK
jgi:hypothetical protein